MRLCFYRFLAINIGLLLAMEPVVCATALVRGPYSQRLNVIHLDEQAMMLPNIGSSRQAYLPVERIRFIRRLMGKWIWNIPTLTSKSFRYKVLSEAAVYLTATYLSEPAVGHEPQRRNEILKTYKSFLTLYSPYFAAQQTWLTLGHPLNEDLPEEGEDLPTTQDIANLLGYPLSPGLADWLSRFSAFHPEKWRERLQNNFALFAQALGASRDPRISSIVYREPEILFQAEPAQSPRLASTIAEFMARRKISGVISEDYLTVSLAADGTYREASARDGEMASRVNLLVNRLRQEGTLRSDLPSILHLRRIDQLRTEFSTGKNAKSQVHRAIVPGAFEQYDDAFILLPGNRLTGKSLLEEPGVSGVLTQILKRQSSSTQIPAIPIETSPKTQAAA